MPQYRPNLPESHPPSRSTLGMLQPNSGLSWIAVVAAALLAAYFIQKLMIFFDVATLSILESLWNCFVYLMPAKLVFALRPRSTFPLSDDIDNANRQHAAKSDVLRNVFGLDKTCALPPGTTTDGIPAGLGNWDNSCYQNSVLQSLASVKSLRSLFDNVQSSSIQDSLTNTTLSALNNLTRDLNNKKDNARHLWTPPKLKSMSSWQQQDAQEYYSKIVEQLEKDIAAVYKVKEPSKQGLELLPETLVEHESKAASLYSNGGDHFDVTSKNAFAVTQTRSLTNPLEGLLAQRVGCTKCGYSDGLSLIPFNCITLPLGREWQYDLKDCLEAFTALEYIEGVECAKCTLLQSRHQLRQLSETLATADEEDPEALARQSDQVKNVDARLEAVTEAVREEDFADSTLTKKCNIPSHLRVSTTKSRQAIVARTPKCLVMHINRSLFDESTGDQLKNYAEVQFGLRLDLSRWCVGNKQRMELSSLPAVVEEWEMDPSRSMIQEQDCFNQRSRNIYSLQAVITHYGRHENGHYICYRKLPNISNSANVIESSSLLEKAEQWWRLSDENVSKVTEDEVLAQGGVFMLFYERIMEDLPISMPTRPSQVQKVHDPTKMLLPLTSYILAEDREMIDQNIVPEDIHTTLQAAEDLPLPESVPSPAVAAVVTNVDTMPPDNVISIESHLQIGSLDATDTESDAEQSVEIISPAELRKKTISPPTMRTAGLPPRHPDGHSPLKSLPMVATL